MRETVVKEILSADSSERLRIFRTSWGAFFYEEEWFRDYSEEHEFVDDKLAPGTGLWVGTERSGYFASAEDTEREARQIYGWLSQS